ncbi:MAG: hypothetical protein JNG89_20405 [Planctomycetaceae bacterium]|nr:hypothetical protein [Planctomycetaceae bacterium]
MRRIARKPVQQRTSADVTELSPWQKICPRCRAVAHIRKKSCACGYNFPAGRHVVPK